MNKYRERNFETRATHPGEVMGVIKVEGSNGEESWAPFPIGGGNTGGRQLITVPAAGLGAVMAVGESFDSVFVLPRLEMEGSPRVFLDVQAISVVFSRNIVSLEAAGSNQPTIQDLGKKTTGLQVDALLIDADAARARQGDNLTAYAKADVLETAMREAREGVFYHPTNGQYRVRLAQVNISHSNRRLGVLDATLTLVVTEERQTVPRFAQSATRGLQDQASTNG